MNKHKIRLNSFCPEPNRFNPESHLKEEIPSFPELAKCCKKVTKKEMKEYIEKNRPELVPLKVNRDRKITIPYYVAKKYNIEVGDVLILIDHHGRRKMELTTKEEYLKI